MATDKRLDQVSTLTDFDYALIVKGDQVAKASKQQLAELVGNLLYGATNASSLATVVAGQIAATGINVLYQGTNPKDFNLITETGIYGCGGAGAENGPTAAPYGTLIVLKSTAFGGGYSVQMFIGRSSTPSFYYRIHPWEWTRVV